MSALIYNAADQLQHLHDILNTDTVKTALGISLTEVDEQGNDLGTPNNYGVCMQSPFFLIPTYLPQVIINMQEQDVTDEQFSTAETQTGFYVYYVMAFTPDTPTNLLMAQKLQYLCGKLLEKRTGEEPYWYSMTLPRVEVQNEVNRFYEEQQIPIAVGRVSFTLKYKNEYR